MNVRVRVLVLALLGLAGALTPGCGDDAQGSIIGGSPITVPGAPTGVEVVPGDKQATVSWQAPVSTGGRFISSYTVKTFAGATELPPVTALPPALSATVTGLTNGTAYTFKVTATSSQGNSVESQASAPATPRVTPGAPQNVSATPGNGQVALSWAAADDKGMPLTGYVVNASTGGNQVATQTVTGTSATFTGLTNGTKYTFAVMADNGLARGAEASADSTPFTRPGAPRVTEVLPTIDQVTLWWAVQDTGGSPITGYTVTVYQGDAVVRVVETTDTRLIVTELANATTYHFTVFATNAAGPGAISERVAGRPLRYPSEPLNPRCTGGDAQAEFSWEPPANDYGDPVTEYRISTIIDGSSRSWVTSNLSYTATGLPNNPDGSLTFSIQARNGGGYGDGARVFCVVKAP